MTEQNKKIEEKIRLIKAAIKKKQSRRYLESLKNELLTALKEIRILQAPKLVKGVDYFDGKDGYTPVKGKDYRDGNDGYTPIKGKDYFDGKDGYTPMRGVDYYTQRDIDILVDALKLSDKEISAIKEAVRPIKGKDYNDGKDGYTPVKGKDYFTEAEVKSIIDLATSGFKITTKQVIKLLSDPKQKYEDRLSVLMLKDLNKLNFGGSGRASGPAGSTTLAGLSDVNLTGLSDGNMIVYDQATGKWIPGTPTDTDEKVKISANDTTAKYLNGAIVNSSEIEWTENNNGGSETFSASIVAGSIDETKLDASVNASLDLADSALQAESDTLGTVTGRGATTSTESKFSNGLITNQIKASSSAGLAVHNASGADIALFGAGGGQNATFYDGVKLDSQTASRILSTDASKNITALDTTTYPDLTELSYVKGVTSAIQTQLNSKISGSGTANQVSYWSGSNTQTGSAGFTYDPTSTINALLISQGATHTPLTLRLATAQTGDLLKFQDAAAGVQGGISSDFQFFTGRSAASGARIDISNNVSATQQLIKLQAHASQSANILQIQNSAATVLFAIDATGNILKTKTSSTTTGVIQSGGNPFLHDFSHPTGNTQIPQGYNVMLGRGAGNFTMGSTATNTVHGSENICVGGDTLTNTTTGFRNVAIQRFALSQLTTGSNNVAIGFQSMYGSASVTGTDNNAVGYYSLQSITSGTYNSAFGTSALRSLTSTSGNVGIGREAGYLITAGTGNTTPTDSIFIGRDSRAAAIGQTNQIVIGTLGRGNGSNTTTLGNTSTLNTYITAGNLNLLNDNAAIRFGGGTDASIYYDGTDLKINPKLVGAGVLSILGDVSLLDEDIILGTTTGTKIGTATSQKLGFWNATPVIQQVTSAYTSDGEGTAYTGIDNAQAGTVYAQLADLNSLRVAYETLRTSYDDLLTKLKNTGIVA